MKIMVFYLVTRKYATLSGFHIYNTIIDIKYAVHDINYDILIYVDWNTCVASLQII